MTNFLCTLQDVRDELNTTSTTDNAKVLQLIRQVSARVNGLFKSTRPFFLPFVEDRKYRVDSLHVNSYDNTFWFRDNLLSLTSVTQGTQALVVGSDVEAWPTIPTPYHYLRFLDFTRTWYDNCVNVNTFTPLFISINGVWGYHSDYANAWLATSSLTVDPLTGATLTVADVDGTDSYGRSPWISAGALLKIEDEYLLVTTTDTAANTAAVKRGMYGTTGVGHAIGQTVYVWQVEDAIRRVVARQTAFLYARMGAYESVSVTDTGVVNYPSDLLAELRGAVSIFFYE